MYIYREASYEKMSRRAANILSAQVIQKPDSVLGLATGSSPLGVYSQLIEWYKKDDLDFKDVSTVNLDEYCGLAPEHEQSYRYFKNHNFFDHINIDKYRTYVPNGLATDWKTECDNYDKLIRALGGIDLQLLGIGFNGHIGFNEPGSAFENGVVDIAPYLSTDTDGRISRGTFHSFAVRPKPQSGNAQGLAHIRASWSAQVFISCQTGRQY